MASTLRHGQFPLLSIGGVRDDWQSSLRTLQFAITDAVVFACPHFVATGVDRQKGPMHVLIEALSVKRCQWVASHESGKALPVVGIRG